MDVKRLAVGAAALALVAGAAYAQDAPAPDPMPAGAGPSTGAAAAAAQQRFQVRTMEDVLENAVQHGAQTVSAQMRLVSPDIALFSGPSRARGFRLPDYGVFFAVEVPALHRSLTWSVRTLTQSNADLARAIQSIRRLVQTQHDARMKTELEQALRLVELQVGPPLGSLPAGASPLVTQASSVPRDPDAAASGQDVASPAGPVAVPAIIANPSAAYTEAVQEALVTAMIDYGSTLNLVEDEWLTVAARENSDSVLAGDLGETITVTLRVRASDLAAYKAGTLTRDETQRRVEVGQF